MPHSSDFDLTEEERAVLRKLGKKAGYRRLEQAGVEAFRKMGALGAQAIKEKVEASGDKDYFRRNGEKGFVAVIKKHGFVNQRRGGKVGGAAVLKKFGPEHFRELSRKAAAKREQEKLDKRESQALAALEKGRIKRAGQAQANTATDLPGGPPGDPDQG